jgi:regulatory subunit for Cdc7p protein kinase
LYWEGQKEKEKKATDKVQHDAERENRNMDPPERTVVKPEAQETDVGIIPSVRREESVPACKECKDSKETDPQKKLPVRPASPRKSSESFIPPNFPRAGPFHLGREPAASGVQPSNITSAIRSQMISSTAAAPGAKAGVSKEVHELKRKVLEKSNGGISTSGIHSSHSPIELSGTMKATRGLPIKTGRGRTQDTLANINEEDTTQSEDDGGNKQHAAAKKGSAQKKQKEKKRDPKPGYCENCRDKFDDFEEVSWLPFGRGKNKLICANHVLAYHVEEASQVCDHVVELG